MDRKTLVGVHKPTLSAWLERGAPPTQLGPILLKLEVQRMARKLVRQLPVLLLLLALGYTPALAVSDPRATPPYSYYPGVTTGPYPGTVFCWASRGRTFTYTKPGGTLTMPAADDNQTMLEWQCDLPNEVYTLTQVAPALGVFFCFAVGLVLGRAV